jgi:hypothetical protein
MNAHAEEKLQRHEYVEGLTNW